MRVVVVIAQLVDAAKDFAQVDRFDGDAARLIEALRVAHRVEGRGTRADGADAQILQALDDAADGGEPGQVGGEFGEVSDSVCSVVSE